MFHEKQVSLTVSRHYNAIWLKNAMDTAGSAGIKTQAKPITGRSVSIVLDYNLVYTVIRYQLFSAPKRITVIAVFRKYFTWFLRKADYRSKYY